MSVLLFFLLSFLSVFSANAETYILEPEKPEDVIITDEVPKNGGISLCDYVDKDSGLTFIANYGKGNTSYIGGLPISAGDQLYPSLAMIGSSVRDWIKITAGLGTNRIQLQPNTDYIVTWTIHYSSLENYKVNPIYGSLIFYSTPTGTTSSFRLDYSNSGNGNFNKMTNRFMTDSDGKYVTVTMPFRTDSTFIYLTTLENRISTADPNGFDSTNYIILDNIVIQDRETADDQGFLSGLIGKILSGISSLGDKISGFFEVLATKIGNFFASLGDKIGGFFTTIWNNIKGAFENLIEKIKGFFDSLFDFLKFLFIPSDDFWANFFQNLSAKLEEHLGFVYQIPEFVVNFFKNLMTFSVGNDPILSIPAISWMGHTVLEANTINLNSYFTDVPALQTVYNIYLSFVTVLFTVMFINYCIKKVRSVTGG